MEREKEGGGGRVGVVFPVSNTKTEKLYLLCINFYRALNIMATITTTVSVILYFGFEDYRLELHLDSIWGSKVLYFGCFSFPLP